MPRNRTARLAVLGSSLQRSASTPYSSRTGPALRRRIVVGLLVVLSLALITAYFREPDSGGLHDAQGVAASVLRPFQVGADRLARPFRDAYGYVTNLLNAKSDATKLRRENRALRLEASQAQTIFRDNRELRKALHFVSSAEYLQGYGRVPTRVISQPDDYDQQLVIDAGVNAGVRRGDAVVTPDGLVGIVSLAHSREARVQLLTDESGAVSAADQRTGARGIVQHNGGASGSFVLNQVQKSDRVRGGDRVVTAGWRLGRLTPLYPKGIPIGVVSSVNEVDTDIFKRVQVDPYVNFSKLEAVIVLIRRQQARR